MSSKKVSLLNGKATVEEALQLSLIAATVNKTYQMRVQDAPFRWDGQRVMVDLYMRHMSIGQALGRMVLANPIFKRVTPSPRQYRELTVFVKGLEQEYPERWDKDRRCFVSEQGDALGAHAQEVLAFRRRHNEWARARSNHTY